jgi:hypothetical protein
LTNKLESTKKSFDEINSYDKKRREKEKNFLQYQSQHLEAILKQFKSKIILLFERSIYNIKIQCNGKTTRRIIFFGGKYKIAIARVTFYATLL